MTLVVRDGQMMHVAAALASEVAKLGPDVLHEG